MYKLFYFYSCPITGNESYRPIEGLWPSVDALFQFLENGFVDKVCYLKRANFIKIPFFGYHSAAFTGYVCEPVQMSKFASSPCGRSERPAKRSIQKHSLRE